jgi:hypothetical protein
MTAGDRLDRVTLKVVGLEGQSCKELAEPGLSLFDPSAGHQR